MDQAHFFGCVGKICLAKFKNQTSGHHLICTYSMEQQSLQNINIFALILILLTNTLAQISSERERAAATVTRTFRARII